jgi:hypothetical protein
MSLLTYQALTLEGRDYEAAYSDYWNSTEDTDGEYMSSQAIECCFLTQSRAACRRSHYACCATRCRDPWQILSYWQVIMFRNAKLETDVLPSLHRSHKLDGL